MAVKLLNPDLTFVVDFGGWIFPPVFAKDNGQKKSPKKSPAEFTRQFAWKSPLEMQDR